MFFSPQFLVSQERVRKVKFQKHTEAWPGSFILMSKDLMLRKKKQKIISAELPQPMKF